MGGTLLCGMEIMAAGGLSFLSSSSPAVAAAVTIGAAIMADLAAADAATTAAADVAAAITADAATTAADAVINLKITAKKGAYAPFLF